MFNLRPRHHRLFAITRLLTALTVCDSEDELDRTFNAAQALPGSRMLDAMMT